MKKKISYTEEPIEAKVIENFLPPPEKLLLKEDTVKVTISLSRDSVDFFKERSKKLHTKYQKMIRELVDQYARQYLST